MRSTHFGLLGGLTAILLCLTSLAALAQEKPVAGGAEPAPGKGGNKTAAAVTFGIDRSPMQTSLGKIGIVRDKAFSNGANFIKDALSPLGFDGFNLLGVNVLKTRIKDYFTQGATVDFRDNVTKKAFREYIFQQYATNADVKIIFDAIKTNVKDIGVPLQEQERLKGFFVVMAGRFDRQESGFRSELFAVERQERASGNQYAAASNFLYSNASLRTDIAAQYFTGTQYGFGFAVNYDLVGHGYFLEGDRPDLAPKNLSNLTFNPHPTDPANKKSLVTKSDFDKTVASLIKSIESPIPERQEDFLLAQYVLKYHSGLSAGFQRLNNLGDFYSVGISASHLRPQRSWREGRNVDEITKHRSDAMFYSVGWRYNWFEIDEKLKAKSSNTLRTTNGVGFSAIVAWQDSSPFLYGAAKDKAVLRPWHSRYGIEYAQSNAVVEGDYIAGFGRWRDRLSMEYGFQAGMEVNGSAFIGGSIGYYFK